MAGALFSCRRLTALGLKQSVGRGHPGLCEEKREEEGNEEESENGSKSASTLWRKEWGERMSKRRVQMDPSFLV